MKIKYLAGLTHEESIENTDCQKEENVEGQDNVDKSKGDIKTVVEENVEKEIISKKEVNHTFILMIIKNFN